MESAVAEFDQAVNLTSLRIVQITSEIIQTIDGKVNFLVVKVDLIATNLAVIREYQESALQQAQESNTKLGKVQQQTQESNAKLDMILQLVKNPNEKAQEKEKGQSGPNKSKADPADRKRHTLNEVKEVFSQDAGWSTVIKETKKQRAEIQSVKEAEKTLKKGTVGTGLWLLDEKEFTAWKSGGTNPVLWIRGPAGIGKSFLAETIATELEALPKDRRSSAYFFFQEEQDALRCWDNAVLGLSVQIAEKDSTYCEHLAIEVAKGKNDVALWIRYLSTKFPKKDEGAHAYIILDGIDEMKATERTKMCEHLKTFAKESSNIHVLLVSRPDIPELQALILPTIDITKENLAVDMHKVILIGCRTLPRLKKFRKTVKTTILRRVRTQADGKRSRQACRRTSL
jgi:hypothetical protein